MKNSNQERLGRAMKQYHSKNKYPLVNGIYIPLVQPENQILSWSDEVLIILNDRQVYVDWEHPRRRYSMAIARMASKEAGDAPMEKIDIFSNCEKKWKKQGRSRKRLAFYVLGSLPERHSETEYRSKYGAISARIKAEGIDFVVRPSISVRRFACWASVTLCIPIEVRDKDDVRALAVLVKRLLKGETTLAREFPDYRYGRAEWLAEAELRNQDNKRRYKNNS